MKIVNICISAPYIEGFAYQENILTDYFLDAAIDTIIIGSNILPSYVKSKKIKPGIYSDKGKKIIRINCFKISNEFIVPVNLYRHLKQERPDVIFHHNLNCTSLIISTFYKIFNPSITLLVDNHADLLNCSQNKLWRLIYQRMLVRASAKFSSLFASKFYGVTYSRCDYLHDVYGVTNKKIKFLPIGTDVNTADLITDEKTSIREKQNIPIDAFVFVTGGKMGADKGTDKLIKSVIELHSTNPSIVLLLFGSLDDKMADEMANMPHFIIYKGWCDRMTTLNMLKLADVAVWPVHHTTLIEDAISVNTPILIRKTRTTEHLVDGNGFFIDSLEYNELYSKMNKIMQFLPNTDCENSCEIIKQKLSYKSIVREVLSDIL